MATEYLDQTTRVEPPKYIQTHAQQLLANVGGSTIQDANSAGYEEYDAQGNIWRPTDNWDGPGTGEGGGSGPGIGGAGPVSNNIGQLGGGFLTDPVAPHVDQNGNPVPRLADLTQDQNRAHELAREGIGSYQPYLDQAGAATTQGINAFNPDAMTQMQGQIDQGSGYNIGQEYLNPFQQNVIDTTMSEMNRQQNIDRTRIGAQAANARSFGGSRHGVLEAETNRGFDANRTNVLAKLNSQNFTQAQMAQEAHRQRQLQGAQTSGNIRNMAADSAFTGAQTAGGIAGLNQQLGVNDISTLGATGDQQQQHRQLQLDVANEEYLREQNRPFQMAQFYSDILGGVPSGETSFSQKEVPGRNRLADALGGLGTLATAGNQFGWWDGADSE